MAIVRKANVILRIKDSELNRYIDLGYDEIDGSGKVIKACVPSDVLTLKRFYVEHIKEIEQLKEQNVQLQEQVKSLTQKLEANKKPETTQKQTTATKATTQAKTTKK